MPHGKEIEVHINPKATIIKYTGSPLGQKREKGVKEKLNTEHLKTMSWGEHCIGLLACVIDWNQIKSLQN